MQVAGKTLFKGFNPEIIGQKPRPPWDTRIWFKMKFHLCVTRSGAEGDDRRFGLVSSRPSLLVLKNCNRSHKYFNAIQAISQENADVSTSSFEDFVVSSNTYQDGHVKVKIMVDGTKTQAIFDTVFAKLVDAAQPIPGFRRVKGGKTPDIPKDILLQILGPSKVNFQSIKKIINSTVREFVEKEDLKVTKSLRVEQSFEELEAMFIPGKEFGFDAVIQLQETCPTKS
ncbi:Trigger factor ribosome-binding bacterial domain-containing protein [Dioscorea alata]|uniref:Trigger factor ribosome-binding bacterial domain-containing protein n=1 Tax=Dioscorea alata TaxID=55571 RepID=A0ACB7UT26_DIOAL|nr:Trigger factor ribosome-binding bacterial domain-containing protein [Dioscorea alata]